MSDQGFRKRFNTMQDEWILNNNGFFSHYAIWFFNKLGNVVAGW